MNVYQSPQSKTANLALIEIAPEILERLLGLPDDVRIVDVQRDLTGSGLLVKVHSPRFDVPAGAVLTRWKPEYISREAEEGEYIEQLNHASLPPLPEQSRCPHCDGTRIVSWDEPSLTGEIVPVIHCRDCRREF